ncbi:MAG: hypothetical protein U1F25_16780 [Rubrivivax sp.]
MREGPFAPSRGRRFDTQAVLLDPTAARWRLRCSLVRRTRCRPRSVVFDPRGYDWEATGRYGARSRRR